MWSCGRPAAAAAMADRMASCMGDTSMASPPPSPPAAAGVAAAAAPGVSAAAAPIAKTRAAATGDAPNRPGKGISAAANSDCGSAGPITAAAAAAVAAAAAAAAVAAVAAPAAAGGAASVFAAAPPNPWCCGAAAPAAAWSGPCKGGDGRKCCRPLPTPPPPPPPRPAGPAAKPPAATGAPGVPAPVCICCLAAARVLPGGWRACCPGREGIILVREPRAPCVPVRLAPAKRETERERKHTRRGLASAGRAAAFAPVAMVLDGAMRRRLGARRHTRAAR